MFTGIIHHRGRVVSVVPCPAGLRLVVAHELAEPVRHGDSIAVDGCCLTAAELRTGEVSFDVIPETLSRTTLGDVRAGAEVHLEQSLRVGDRVDGHFVQGHVDGRAEVLWVRRDSEWRARLVAPPELAKYLIPKGSVAIAGVSLTLAQVEGREFEIALIPTTLQLTRLGSLNPGDHVNLECDPTVKTIVATLERVNAATVSP